MKKSIALLLVIMMSMSLIFAGCGSTNTTAAAGETAAAPGGTAATPAENTEFTIAFCTWIGYAPLYIAQEKGLFEKYGIKPTLTIIEDESQYAAALYSNSIQALGNVLDREVIHFAKGTPETFILAMDESSGGDGVIATADIKTVADLKGKTVGLDKSSTSYFFFLTILKKNGVDEKDIKISEMGVDAAGAAFLAGSLDAAVVWEPYLSEAGTREGGHVLVDSKEFPRTIVDVLTVRSDFAEKNPKAVEGLTKAWYDAIDYYLANPDDGNAIMAKGLGLETQDIADMASGVSFMGRKENAAFFDKTTADNIYEVSERAVGFWREKEIITEDVDIEKLVSGKFFNVAQ